MKIVLNVPTKSDGQQKIKIISADELTRLISEEIKKECIVDQTSGPQVIIQISRGNTKDLEQIRKLIASKPNLLGISITHVIGNKR